MENLNKPRGTKKQLKRKSGRKMINRYRYRKCCRPVIDTDRREKQRRGRREDREKRGKGREDLANIPS